MLNRGGGINSLWIGKPPTGYRYRAFPVVGIIEDAEPHSFTMANPIASTPPTGFNEQSFPVDYQILEETSQNSVDVWLTNQKPEQFSYSSFTP